MEVQRADICLGESYPGGPRGEAPLLGWSKHGAQNRCQSRLCFTEEEHPAFYQNTQTHARTHTQTRTRTHTHTHAHTHTHSSLFIQYAN